jgi:tRNA pseudouridine38-40 synthase
MARYKVTVAYDGTQFEGFQRQGRARTVQLELENALRSLRWQGRTILSAGRTDSGVHAEGQVIAFDFEWVHSLEALGKALNANLPSDVSVREVEVAPEGFHPRYDAAWRCYRYTVHFAPVRNPLRDRFAWRVWPPCEIDLLHEADQLLPGSHDFSAFGTPPRPGGSTIRAVYQATWHEREEGLLSFVVIANAFLYHMVRRMVYVQVRVGQGRLALDDLKAAVEQGALMAPGLAPPQGLVLQQVHYAERRQVTQE